jgi:lysophospholipase L1-like esterase
MTLALLQPGTGGALCLFASPMPDVSPGVPDTTSPPGLPRAALAALGPVPCVVGLNARGSETPDQILAFAEERTGRTLWWGALIGFSRGCQTVRSLWLAGAAALALVLADGMAGQNPPTPVQLGYARSIVALARTGAILTCISHTYIDMGPAVTSTANMARIATGWALEAPPQGQTVRRVQEPAEEGPGWHGALVVYSTGSGLGDQAAHRDQANKILPIALATYLRPLVELALRPDVAAAPVPSSSPEPAAQAVSLSAPGASAAAGTRAATTTASRASAPAPAPASPWPASPSASSPSSPGVRVLLIGDSFAQGIGPPLAQLAEDAGLHLVQAGVKSTTIRDWLKGSRLADAVAAASPICTLVSLGANDMGAADPAAEGRRAGELLDALDDLDAGAVVWIAPPRMPVDKSSFRAALAAACAKRARIFDSLALTLERAPHDFHMTPAGYRAWAEAIARWVPFAGLAAASTPPGTVLPPPRPRPPNEGRTPVDASASLGERAAVFSLEEQRDGVREDPPGSHRGPRIDQYRHGLGNPGDNWCAWGFCYAGRAVLQPGETLPHAYSGSVAELVKSGRFHPLGDGYAPKLGDGAIWARDGQDPTHGGHGHVGRLLVGPDQATGSFESIEANSTDHAWAQRQHRLEEAGFLGWLEYPQPARAAHVLFREPFVVAGFGELGLDDYVGRVVTGEMGSSRQIQALKAQAIAARTFVQRALRDDPQLGTVAKPVPNSESFQVAAPIASPLAARAAAETHGGVALYRGRLILANYVAGAPWAPGTWKGIESPKYPTERHVTYNAGRRGTAVLPTHQVDPRHRDNRGGMSQNGADALAARGWTWPPILRFFYGSDLDFTIPEPADMRPQTRPPMPSSGNPTSDNTPLYVAAAVAAAWKLWGSA